MDAKETGQQFVGSDLFPFLRIGVTNGAFHFDGSLPECSDYSNK